MTSPPYITTAAYTVSMLPEHLMDSWEYTLRVERTGRRSWALRHLGRCWNFGTHTWDIEPQPSSRSDAWLSAARRDLESALAEASHLAPEITVNGMNAAAYLRWREENR